MWQQLDWSNWLYGLFAGMIGGGATAVTGALAASAIDSNDFGFGTSRSVKLMAAMFLMSALKDTCLYLKQNPLPKIITVTTVQTTEQISPKATQVTKVEQTTIQKQPPEPPPTPPVDQAKP